jgi:integrase
MHSDILAFVHTARMQQIMATFSKLPSGQWRVQVRRKKLFLSRTFRIKAHAEQWAREQEQLIDKGLAPTAVSTESRETFASLIDLHLADLKELRRGIGRSKEHTLFRLRDMVGATRVSRINREFLVDFAKRRAKQGAGPVTIGIDLSFIGTVLEHAAAVHGITVPTEQVRLGRIALNRLGLVAKSAERDRRPTADELAQIIATADANPRQIIPLGRIVKFAVATALRQDEISRVMWEDFDPVASTLLVRQRKHPRQKARNDQMVPLVADTGFDAVAVIKEQGERTGRATGFIFPYDGRSVGTAFRRVCRDLGIENLHFHDLRHEAISRLFEADWDIPQVAAVSGHKDWKMLQRYTHLRPSFIASRAGRARQMQGA